MMETPSGDFPNLINALLYMPPHAIITLLSIIISYFPYFLAFFYVNLNHSSFMKE